MQACNCRRGHILLMMQPEKSHQIYLLLLFAIVSDNCFSWQEKKKINTFLVLDREQLSCAITSLRLARTIQWAIARASAICDV